jgi:hypothetical protein
MIELELYHKYIIKNPAYGSDYKTYFYLEVSPIAYSASKKFVKLKTEDYTFWEDTSSVRIFEEV